MKKILLASIGIASMLLPLTGCSSEEPLSTGDGSGKITFSVRLPKEIATRAYGDGKSANQLQYYVYPKGSTTPIISETMPIAITATVPLQLVNGESYDIVFWAQNDKCTAYTYNPATKEVTVNYSNVLQNDESRDAFYTMKSVTVSGGDTQEALLYRPFAQVNFGTDDLTAKSVTATYGADYASLKTSLNVTTTVPNVINLSDGSVSGSETISFGANGIPATTEVFPVEGSYNYLSMDYILCGKTERTLIDMNLNIYNGTTLMNTVNVPYAPIQANYQTNIYGKLLTTTNTFNVEIKPAFNPDQYNLYQPAAWDGKTVTTPAIDETAKTVTLNQPSDFIGLAQLVNGNGSDAPKNFEGYTISLAADFDFAGNEIPMISQGATRSGGDAVGNSFKGVIDGKNHTLKNFTINETGNNGNIATGFIASLSGANAALKNLTFENISIKTTNGEQTGIVGLLTDGATVSNVNVKSGTIQSKESPGGIVGRMIINGTVENCSNAATITSTTTNAGGIVGTAYRTDAGKEMHINNCTNTGNVTSGHVCAGGIVGFSTAFIEGCNNYGKIVGTQNSAGGIAGTQRTAGGIKNCNNYADVTVKANGNLAGLAAGGIAGWVTYQGGSAYNNINLITIENCTNSGNISALPTGISGTGNSYAAGGIVGLWYNMGVVKGCKNTATSISAQQMVAGIVGSSQWLADSSMPTGVEDMLYVTDNSTTTTLDQMTGSLKALLVYINNADKVTLSGNTPATNN